MAEAVSTDEFEEICGESFDHDIAIDYEGPDGTQWHCRECEVEGWDEPESPPTPPAPEES